ncbi:MAG: phosphoribosyltransferase family protein [Myxococcota bacterium]|nr:phosphoribosyltransferase family protein [Myxococcota bacterium]
MGSQDWLEFLFPPSCSACGRASSNLLCEDCTQNVPWLEAVDARRPGPKPLAETLAPTSFTGPVRQWILQFKYPPKGLFGTSAPATGLVLMLARAAADRAQDSHPNCITPIPAHRRRFQKRGFEPSYQLAHEIARHRGIKLEPRLLTRIRNTPAQTGLPASTRVTNMKDAFVCRREHLPARACVWLVDDVVTTGATLASAARALKRAGAKQVVGLCLARTLTERFTQG